MTVASSMVERSIWSVRWVYAGWPLYHETKASAGSTFCSGDEEKAECEVLGRGFEREEP
jgi:hypothetical protein